MLPWPNLTTEQWRERLHLPPPSKALKFNPLHRPSGPGGGQFAPKEGGGEMRASDFANDAKNSIAEDSMEKVQKLIYEAGGKGVYEDERASNAKAAVQEQLSASLKDNADWQKYLKLTHSTLEVGDEEVSHLVHQWSKTSSDTSEESLLLQAMVAEEFGLEGHRNAGLAAPEGVHYFDPKDPDSLADSVVRWRTDAPDAGFKNPKPVNADDRETVKNGYRAFVREMYKQTQADLSAHGIESLYLARGVVDTLPVGINNLRLHPMSSFSVDVGNAYNFAGGSMIFAKVPASRVLATPRTGFGCLSENEVVVLGPGVKGVVLPRGKVMANWSNEVAAQLSKKPKKAMPADDTIDVDSALEDADWTKTAWDLPPYKSPEFMRVVTDLDLFRKLPVYLHAVRTGLIKNDEWVGKQLDPLEDWWKEITFDQSVKDTIESELHRALFVQWATKYDPDEPRDDRGRWTSGGGSDVLGEPKNRDRVFAVGRESLAKEGLPPEKMAANATEFMDAGMADASTKKDGTVWYDDENSTYARDIAAQGPDGMTTNQAAGMLAATSPQVPVERARVDARNAAIAIAEGGKLKITQDKIEERYQKQLLAASREKNVAKANAAVAKAEADRTRWLSEDLGKTYDVRTGDASRVAEWHPLRGGAMTDGWTKAIRIARGEDPGKVLEGFKVRSFWDNIAHPTTSDAVTIDGWMAKAISGNPNLKAGEIQQLIGSRGRYEAFSQAVRTAAAKYKVPPLQAQAIIWTAYRKKYGPRGTASKE